MSIPHRRVADAVLQCLLVLFVTANMGASIDGQDISVANVNGRSISRKEVETFVIAQTLPLEEKLYVIRKTALENLIIRSLLEDEAEKRGISVAELRKQLAAGEVNILSGQVEAAYADNASFFASMSPDEAKERLRLDMENQQRMENYRTGVAKLREGAKIDLFLKEPRLPALNDDSTAPSIGPKNSAITVLEFSDFECPYCRSVQSTIKQVMRTYKTEVRLVFKHLPLQIHEQAFLAAQASFCAGEQNMFWQYQDALFAAESLSPTLLNKFALDLSLNLPRFKECLMSESSRAAVLSNLREANQLGINSTPTFIINGKLVRGALRFEQFKAIIESELKLARNSSQLPQPQPLRKD